MLAKAFQLSPLYKEVIDLQNNGWQSLANTDPLYDIRLLNDYSLLSFLRSSIDKMSDMNDKRAALQLLDAYEARRVYKQIFRIPRNTALLDGKHCELLDVLADPKQRKNIEECIEKHNKLPRGTILIYCPEWDMSLKEVRANIIWKGNKPRALDSIAEEENLSIPGEVAALKMKYRNLWNTYIFIHPQFYNKAFFIQESISEGNIPDFPPCLKGIKNDPALLVYLNEDQDFQKSMEYRASANDIINPLLNEVFNEAARRENRVPMRVRKTILKQL